MSIIKKNRKIHPLLLSAKLISNVFHPVYYPVVALGILFFTSFLKYMELPGIIFVMCLTAVFTIFLPTLLTYLYTQLFSIHPQRFLQRHERFIPYTIHLLCYVVLVRILHGLHANGLILDVIIIATLIQICCTILNCFWKVSMHAAGAGGIIGFLLAHGALLGFSPVMPMIMAIFISGLVGTSRLILRRHTLAQVNVGSILGVLCGIIGTVLSSFREFLYLMERI